jgi:hypothetical protein
MPLGRVASIGRSAIGLYIVARCTSVCIGVRQSPVAKQSLAKKNPLWVLSRRDRNWRDRLTIGVSLEGW